MILDALGRREGRGLNSLATESERDEPGALTVRLRNRAVCYWTILTRSEHTSLEMRSCTIF